MHSKISALESEKSYIPKIKAEEFCENMNLCSMRKQKDWEAKIAIKHLDWKITEEKLKDIINKDTYKNKKIIRTYSSGHVFIEKKYWNIFMDDKYWNVFLLTTDKNGVNQHQFTWWSPKEEKNKEIFIKDGSVYKFDLEKAKNNARIRTKIRTWVKVLNEYNKKPLVDWVLIEKNDYYKLVCLIHFIAKDYEWFLDCTLKENTIEWKFYSIEELSLLENKAPNVEIISNYALKLLNS